jgi:hypothetical protein
MRSYTLTHPAGQVRQPDVGDGRNRSRTYCAGTYYSTLLLHSPLLLQCAMLLSATSSD